VSNLEDANSLHKMLGVFKLVHIFETGMYTCQRDQMDEGKTDICTCVGLFLGKMSYHRV
jgi:hypothetical protein